jgi:hypothetical protein
MIAADNDLVMSQPNGDVRTDHVPGHEDQFLHQSATQAPASEYEDVQPAHRQIRASLGCGDQARGRTQIICSAWRQATASATRFRG